MYTICARLPFSSKYKFRCRIMAEAKDGADPIELAKGAPEQLHERCSARCLTEAAHEAYGSLVRAYGHEGDVEVVWETWRGMRTRRITPMSIAKDNMVEALCTNGDPGAGYELLQEAMGDVTARPLMNAGRRSRRRREKGLTQRSSFTGIPDLCRRQPRGDDEEDEAEEVSKVAPSPPPGSGAETPDRTRGVMQRPPPSGSGAETPDRNRESGPEQLGASSESGAETPDRTRMPTRWVPSGSGAETPDRTREPWPELQKSAGSMSMSDFGIMARNWIAQEGKRGKNQHSPLAGGGEPEGPLPSALHDHLRRGDGQRQVQRGQSGNCGLAVACVPPAPASALLAPLPPLLLLFHLVLLLLLLLLLPFVLVPPLLLCLLRATRCTNSGL